MFLIEQNYKELNTNGNICASSGSTFMQNFPSVVFNIGALLPVEGTRDEVR